MDTLYTSRIWNMTYKNVRFLYLWNRNVMGCNIFFFFFWNELHHKKCKNICPVYRVLHFNLFCCISVISQTIAMYWTRSKKICRIDRLWSLFCGIKKWRNFSLPLPRQTIIIIFDCNLYSQMYLCLRIIDLGN